MAFISTVTGSQTTACTLYFVGTHPGASSYSMTHSGNSCTKTITSIPQLSYVWYVQASDGTNTTNSGQSTIIVNDGKTGGRYLQQQGKLGGSLSVAGSQGSNIPTGWIVIGIVVIIVLVIIFKRK